MAALQGTILASYGNSIEEIEKKAKFEKKVIIKKEPEK